MTTMNRTSNPYNHGSRSSHRQRGTILLVSLIIMLLLTILGVTALNNVTMEERMAGNLRDGDLAFQAAEAALRAGENLLAPLTVEPSICTDINSTCSNDKVWAEGVLPSMVYQDSTWWDNHAQDYINSAGGTLLTGGDTADTGPHTGGAYVAATPQFNIQVQKFVRDSSVIGHSNETTGDIYYLITAHSFGGSAAAESVLQTTFSKRFK